MTITRRDFLNGTALTIAAGLAPVQLLHAQQAGAGAAYPPALTGLRGNHPGTYTLAAVQEKLGEQEQKITIAPKGSQTVDFTFKPGGAASAAGMGN